MNIFKKMFIWGICVSSLCNAVADVIPSSELMRPAGCLKTGENEYMVGVAKRNNISNTTPGLLFTPDIKMVAGKAVVFSADMRCSGIASDAKGEHVGGKILVSYKDSSGRMRFYATKSMIGTIPEWHKQFIKLNIPADAENLAIIFGIQQGWGKLEVRNPRMDIVRFGLPANGAKTAIPMDMLVANSFSRIKDGIVTVNIPKRVPMPNQTLGASVNLDLENMREKIVKVSGQIRYDVGSDVIGSHVGAKALATSFDKNSGTKPSWYSSDSFIGSSGDVWKDFSALLKVYDSTTSSNLIFGIQQGWGTANFRNLSMEVVCPVDGVPSYQIPENFKCEYSPRVLAAAPRRGFMSPVPGRIKADDIREMGKWGANLIRYQMVDGIGVPENVTEYIKWLNNCLDKLDSLMPVLKENNIKVVIDMHQALGGRYKQGNRPPQTEAAKAAVRLTGKADLHRIFCEADMRQAFIDAWKTIARRYKDNPVIFGYDLVNEPAVTGPSPYHLLDVQYDAAKAIREIDPETPIIIEGNRCASAIYFNVRPMPLKNIIYEVHMYFPGEYCFQGVNDFHSYSKYYPRRGVAYNSSKEELRSAMSRVIEFQKKYGAKVYVGEFTVPRWVPDGGAKYLEDLISVFEDNKWDWTFHAFREWEGFSPEHYGHPLKPVFGDNDRKTTLQKFFKRNTK
jgi:glycoside hydrolase family 5